MPSRRASDTRETTSSARRRQRQPPRPSVIASDHSKGCALLGASLACFALGCGHGTVPRPPATPIVAGDYVEVPFTPRPPPVEIVPPRPAAAGDLVWADGGWEWTGERYRWEPGAWVAVPAGGKRARWVVVRREVDGQLFFAPSSWRNAEGNAVRAPRPLARALQRAGGAASGIDAPEPGAEPAPVRPRLPDGPADAGADADKPLLPAPARSPGVDE